jgi:type I restriction enzyme S subunit
MSAHECAEMRIGDLGEVYTGRTPSSERPDYFGSDLPFITPGDMRQGKYAKVTERSLSSEGAMLLSRIRLPANSVCVSCIGWQMGEVVMTNRPSVTNQQINSIVPNGKVEPSFLYYSLLPRKQELLALGTMAGVRTPILNKSAFCDLKVQVPPLPIQRRIAGILSAYDELIENSQQRIKILEGMARALYREWFVHFRFPGHESVPRVPSPLGEIPKGWEVKKLGDFVEFKSGFAFKSGTFSADGEYRLVTIKNVQDGSFHPESDSRIDELPQKMPPYCVLVDGDILLSLTGNVGRVCLVYDGPFLLNQRVSKLVPLDASDWAMTYCMFREPEMRIKLEMLSNGVAQQNLSPVLASQMEAALPPRQLRQNFKVAAEPMVRSVVQLFSKIQNLRRTRDLLLPRLLSGQIDVEALPS